jgi:hypothetical protein
VLPWLLRSWTNGSWYARSTFRARKRAGRLHQLFETVGDMIISLENRKVTIRRRDEEPVEGVVLTRTEYKMRVAVKDADDAAVFVCVDGTWISEDCEPVEICFDWHRHKANEPISEANCICPKELAARLIHSLVSGEDVESEMEMPAAPTVNVTADRGVEGRA